MTERKVKTSIEKAWRLFYQFGRKESDEQQGELYNNAEKLIMQYFPDEWEKCHEWCSDIQVGGSMYSIFTYKALSLPEKVIDGFRQEHLLLHNFYIIEQFRIPLRNEPTLKNILTVAYRIGQLSKWLKVRQYPEGLVHTYKKLYAHRMINFINRDISIPEQLPKIICQAPNITLNEDEDSDD